MTDKYILDEEGNPIPCENLLEWGKWFQDADRKVERTQIGDVTVSTIFLGLDHSYSDEKKPILYETMVFGGRPDEYMRRYSTKVEAQKGHDEIVEKLKNGEVLE